MLQFRALSDQMYRSPEYHKHIRKEIVKQVYCPIFVSFSFSRMTGISSLKYQLNVTSGGFGFRNLRPLGFLPCALNVVYLRNEYLYNY